MTNLGRDYLFDWDEGIYAELGRQAVTGGHWWTNYWNGAPWFEKPPGISWLSGLGIALFGPTALGARLFSPIFAIYVLYLVYLIGKKLQSWQTGALAAGILATFNLFLGRTRGVNVDMPLLASLTTTIYFLLTSRSPLLVALAIFSGVWFKGLAGLLTLAIALPLFFTKPKNYVLSTINYLLFFILPWHLYSYLRYGSDFATPYFVEQVLRRATTQIEFHFENRWYYFTYLYENLGLGVLLVSGIGSIIALLRSHTRFLLWWAIFPLGLFTVAKTRLFWYILPIYPALALTCALAITYWAQTARSRLVVTILTIGVLFQGVYSASRSVELGKTVVPMPDRLQVVQSLRSSNQLLVLVPPSERLAEALLPPIARLSSSFRYGGMPSVVFYYQDQVKFYYDVDAFRADWKQTPASIALVARDDLPLLSPDYQLLSTTPTYLGIGKEKK